MLKNKFLALGLMSGTSVDGLDIALCEFLLHKKKWQYKIVSAKTYHYSNKLKAQLRNADNSSASDLFLLSNSLANYFSEKVNLFLKNNPRPEIICSHGHTIFHQPKNGLTVQIGNGAIIAAKTGIKTICDFRTSDVAHGGQGAPLVPIGDLMLFNEFDFCLNIGGFANISQTINNKHIAYDICGVNLVLNYLCSKIKLEYDKGGKIAKSGKVDADLLLKLNALSYYTNKPPKSLGKEWLIEKVFPLIDKSKLPIKDIIATYTEHCAIQIAKCLGNNPKQKALFTGGGVKNDFLLDRIKNHTNTQIIIPDKEVVDFKEALIFAFLGVLRFIEVPNSLSSVTGAKKDSIGGAIYLA